MATETKGVKRKLLDDGISSCSSPECLLPLQPVSDSEEECTLPSQPITDPYCSDESFRGPDSRIRSNTRETQLDPSYIMKQITSWSDISPAEALFFWDMDYISCGETIDVQQSSTVEILKHMFKFISDHEVDEYGELIFKDIHPNNVKYNRKSVVEIYRDATKKNDMLSWLDENDFIDIKNLPTSEFNTLMREKANFIGSSSCSSSGTSLRYEIHVWKEMVKRMKAQHDCGGLGADVMRGVLHDLQTLCRLPRIRGFGECKYSFGFVMPDDLVTKDSDICEARHSTILVHPDTVFTAMRKNSEMLMGRIVVQVFTTEADSKTRSTHSPKPSKSEHLLTIADKIVKNSTDFKTSTENQPTENNTYQLLKDKYKAKEFLSKPDRDINAILDSEYCSHAITYVSQSLPCGCSDNHCIKKMSAQHVLELIALAKEKIERNSADGKAVGMFVKNEYIFLSKLLISNEKIIEFMEGSSSKKIVPSGKVKFSNWKLDLTKSRHRMALFIFLREYLINVD